MSFGSRMQQELGELELIGFSLVWSCSSDKFMKPNPTAFHIMWRDGMKMVLLDGSTRKVKYTSDIYCNDNMLSVTFVLSRAFLIFNVLTGKSDYSYQKNLS